MSERVFEARAAGRRAALAIGFVLVLIGMINNTPSIPGLDDALIRWSGNPDLAIRKFPYQWLYPITFLMMMGIVVLHHSIGRAYRTRGTAWKALGWTMDAAMLACAIVIAITYLVEIESVCLADRFTGDRERLVAESLRAAQEMAKTYGLPMPTSADDPQCANTTGLWLFAIVGIATAVFLAYNAKVWGLPLVAIALIIAGYALVTVLVWYFHGSEDISKYLVTKLGGEPRQLVDGRPNVHDILVSNSRGYLGQFLAVLLDTVFPYIVLGSLFGASAGGQALIKLAFRWSRRLRGGPGHAAIISSAMFGTISGGPVVNVLATGVLTIPMMLKRGFSATFAGGVEAAASSGGQIMPPVMGVAAFVLASMTLVPYSEVIVAAVIPSLAYFFCLFLSVVFQARKQRIVAMGDLTPDLMLSRQDKLNLLMISLPIGLILFLLLTSKEAIGCGFLARWMGVKLSAQGDACVAENLPWLLQLLQNSAGDAGSAGWWSVLLLLGLLFLDPDVRRAPVKIVNALADSGVLVSTLSLMFLAVTVIDVGLGFTGLSDYLSRDILGWLRSFQADTGGSWLFLLTALTATMALAVLLGMGMPTVPAYINVALLMGPMLTGLGIATFTAHMFVFYFAVASAITPPVAIAAFAAASISRADPIATGLSAVRSGIVMFVIPFVFAFYPELLLIDAAVLDPVKQGKYLAGYDGSIHVGALAWLLARLTLALYLLASALTRHDFEPMPWWEVAVRLVLFVVVLLAAPQWHLAGVAMAAGLLLWRSRGAATRLRAQTA